VKIGIFQKKNTIKNSDFRKKSAGFFGYIFFIFATKKICYKNIPPPALGGERFVALIDCKR